MAWRIGAAGEVKPSRKSLTTRSTSRRAARSGYGGGHSFGTRRGERLGERTCSRCTGPGATPVHLSGTAAAHSPVHVAALPRRPSQLHVARRRRGRRRRGPPPAVRGGAASVVNSPVDGCRAKKGGAIAVLGGSLEVVARPHRPTSPTNRAAASSWRAAPPCSPTARCSWATRRRRAPPPCSSTAARSPTRWRRSAARVPSAFLCKPYRLPCPPGDGSCDADAQPLFDTQPCDYANQPALLGRTIAMLAPGGLDEDYPYACAPGCTAAPTRRRRRRGQCATGRCRRQVLHRARQ